MATEPSWEYEQLYWQQGISMVAGIDEAGMGALAGPVVAGVVIFNSSEIRNPKFEIRNVLIRDSKTLSAMQRERAAVWIRENAIAWAIAHASVEEITQFNIRGAAHLAMRRAVESLTATPDLLLIDGPPPRKATAGKHLSQPFILPSEYIIDGDALCFSISAASILAKVDRDSRMRKLDAEFPAYGFAGHKGYGSAAHLAALREHGPCPHHRPSYAPVAALLTRK